MRKYRVVIKWNHRRWGPQLEKLTGEGSSARRALNAALLGFFSDASNREKRRDAHQHFKVEVTRIKRP